MGMFFYEIFSCTRRYLRITVELLSMILFGFLGLHFRMLVKICQIEPDFLLVSEFLNLLTSFSGNR